MYLSGLCWASKLFAGNQRESKKAYVVLYSCSLTRGVFLELLSSLETKEFIQSRKRLIARRGRPSKVYSDNGKTFVAAAKWLEKVCKDEKFNDFLSQQLIIWQFNLSLIPVENQRRNVASLDFRVPVSIT